MCEMLGMVIALLPAVLPWRGPGKTCGGHSFATSGTTMDGTW